MSASRLVSLVQSVTIEPVLLVYMLGLELYWPVYQQLIKEHVCRQIDDYPQSVCANLSAHPVEDAHVRGQWAVWGWYIGVTNTPTLIVFLLFVAPWSDRNGRKWMMLAAPSFSVLTSLQLLANVYWPNLPIWQLFLVILPVSLSGGAAGLTAACNAYAADVSDRGASRSVRMAMLHVSASVGKVLGSLLGSFLYRWLGPAGPFSAYLLCSIFNILYIAVRVTDRQVIMDANSEVSASRRLRALFDMGSLRRMWRVLWRKRDGERRRLLHIYIGAFTGTVIVSRASMGLPFFEGPPINWSLSFSLLFNAINYAFDTTCRLILFPLIKFKLKVLDGTLTVIGPVAGIVGRMITFNARSGFYLFLAMLPDAFDYASIAQQTLVSRVVDDDEQGCLFATVAIIEHVVPGFASYAFARVFEASAATMPTLVYGIGAVLLIGPLSLYAWADVLDRRAGMSETQ